MFQSLGFTMCCLLQCMIHIFGMAPFGDFYKQILFDLKGRIELQLFPLPPPCTLKRRPKKNRLHKNLNCFEKESTKASATLAHLHVDLDVTHNKVMYLNVTTCLMDCQRMLWVSKINICIHVNTLKYVLKTVKHYVFALLWICLKQGFIGSEQTVNNDRPGDNDTLRSV